LDEAASRYTISMKLTIELSPAQAERLRHEAARLGLAPEDLARAAIADLLAIPGDDFKAAAERVLRKNEELYRRLA
jgi:predicted transcriptional regulator